MSRRGIIQNGCRFVNARFEAWSWNYRSSSNACPIRVDTRLVSRPRGGGGGAARPARTRPRRDRTGRRVAAGRCTDTRLAPAYGALRRRVRRGAPGARGRTGGRWGAAMSPYLLDTDHLTLDQM